MSEETAPTQTSETTTDVVDTTALNAAGEDATTVDTTTDTENTEAATDDTTALNAGGNDGADETVEAKAEVPETYELTAPEGITLDAAAVDLATPVFKELGLSNDQANKLMPVAAEWAAKIQDDANKAILASVQGERKAWLDTAKADPEIGGAQWDKTIVTAASALDKLGLTKGSPFRVLLDESGLGNHPEMIRAFKKVGEAIGEDSNFVRGDAARSDKPIDARWYQKGE